ncbi:MAG: HEAT repeat domain-containing protein [Methanoregula sp.]|nr:HEAT repeat domain-containing protein [Methanoregula sp.]
MSEIAAKKEAGDIQGLIRMLNHGNPEIQWRAADALGSMGEPACLPLVRLLTYPRMNVRIGAIEALGTIKDPRAVDPLLVILSQDTSNEVRWVAAIALGSIGDPRVIPHLEDALQDDDRYVRYGAAKALEELHWRPTDDEAIARLAIALQDWQAVRRLGLAAVDSLIAILKDKNPNTRTKIIELLGEIRGPHATGACEAALKDPDPSVRWSAVTAAKKCGVEDTRLPMILARRQRTIPSPLGAAILNLFFFGLGYNYIGKWWGFLVFMCYMTMMVLVQLNTNYIFPFIIAYPITAIFAVHTYFMVKRMPDM